MEARARFDTALEATRRWHEMIPAAQAYCTWPDDLGFVPRAPHLVPAEALLRSQPGTPSARSTALMKALQAISRDVEWRLTYTVDEVGQRFLDTFGWFELAGPDGHFRTRQTRITIGYWGPGLFYPRHQHGPDELYTVVSGEALFHTDGQADARLGPESTRFHAPNQPHALTTEDQPVLTLVFWRGQGLDETPRLSR